MLLSKEACTEVMISWRLGTYTLNPIDIVTRLALLLPLLAALLLGDDDPRLAAPDPEVSGIRCDTSNILMP